MTTCVPAAILVVLLVCLIAGARRVIHGPGDADRMLSAQLLGTAAVAIMVILGRVGAMPALFDVALVMALLAVVTVVAYVALSARGGQ